MGQPAYRLVDPLRRGGGICQDVLCQQILRMGIFQFSGFLQPLQRGTLIALGTHAMQEHPADAVLEPVIRTLIRQHPESIIGRREISDGLPLV